jgi:hypothetical protein
MLKEGFKEQIYNIFMMMPQDIQVWLNWFVCFEIIFLLLDDSSIGHYA